jgi:hypothetical protein
MHYKVPNFFLVVNGSKMDVNCLATCCAMTYFQEFGLYFHIEGWEKVMKPNHHELLRIGNDLDVNMDDVN